MKGVEDEAIAISRIFYGRYREVVGAPPVFCNKLSESTWVLWMKDGWQMELDGRQYGNAWDAKADALKEWASQQ